MQNAAGQVVNLSPDQRMLLFEQTGRHLFRLRVDPATSVGSAVDRSCTRCLLNDALSDVTISSDGLCNYCLEFAGGASEGAFDEIRVITTIAQKRGRGSVDCAIAYSGGKDSAAVLLIALRRYGLHPLAIMVDNGFIPPVVQESAAEFCANLGVPFVVRPIELARSAARALAQTTPSIPCRACIKSVFAVVAAECVRRNIDLVIAGYRFPPLQFPLSVCTNHQEHSRIVCVSPLLSLRMLESEQLELIAGAGWKRVDIAGNTSNCQLIGYVEEVVFDRIGYSPHIYEVSKEIRAGFYSRAVGMHKLQRPTLSEQHRREVMQKLSSWA